jgi:hypothetical protein
MVPNSITSIIGTIIANSVAAMPRESRRSAAAVRLRQDRMLEPFPYR